MKLHLPFLALILFFSGCQKEPHRESSCSKILLNVGIEPPCLDPRKLIDNLSYSVVKMCFDGLTRVSPSGKCELSLAKSYTLSDDLKTYTFELRESYWSDKKRITAKDFEETWTRILDPNFPSPSSYFFFLIEGAEEYKKGSGTIASLGIKAISDDFLTIRLKEPNPYFLHLLSTVYFHPYPERIAQTNGLFLKKQAPAFLCNGPFTIQLWENQNKLLLKKNTVYFDQSAVSLDKIELVFIQDPSTELSLYEQKKLDWCGAPFSTLSQDALPQLRQRSDYHTQSSASLYYYAFNTDSPALKEKKIRQALSLAIHRKSLIEHIVQTEALPAAQFVPPSLCEKSIDYFVDFDCEKAKLFFDEGCCLLGVDKKDFPTLTLFYNSGYPLHEKLAQAIKDQWLKTLGIDVELESKEWKVFLDTIKNKKFDIARFGFGSISPDPSFFLDIFTSRDHANNHTCWENQMFNFLVKKAKTSSKFDERAELIHKAQKLLLEEMPIAPLFFYKQAYLKNPKIHNVVLDEFNNIDFKWAYLESR